MRYLPKGWLAILWITPKPFATQKMRTEKAGNCNSDGPMNGVVLPLAGDPEDSDALCDDASFDRAQIPQRYRICAFLMIILFSTGSSYAENVITPLKTRILKELKITSALANDTSWQEGQAGIRDVLTKYRRPVWCGRECELARKLYPPDHRRYRYGLLGSYLVSIAEVHERHLILTRKRCNPLERIHPNRRCSVWLCECERTIHRPVTPI